MNDWKLMQYEQEDNFRIQITGPEAAIRDIAFANVEVELEDGSVKQGVGTPSGIVLLRF